MISVSDLADRYDLFAFVSRTLRLDDAAVVRFRRREDGLVSAWMVTPFEVLATRALRINIPSPDEVYSAQMLHQALSRHAQSAGEQASAELDPGYSLHSSWSGGALPPEGGYSHVDDVPARAVVDLAREGAATARTHSGPMGPPPSLLSQTVLIVSTPDTSHDSSTTSDIDEVAITMRSVFAMAAMGFITDAHGRLVTESSSTDAIAPDEMVRIRATAAWARLDARFGSVYQRRTPPISVMAL